MTDLISEPLEPVCGTFDTKRMGRGEPGLPTAFLWRGKRFDVGGELSAWKESSREGGVGELYLRRHYYKLLLNDGTVWTVYFIRQAAQGGDPKHRWFLYTIDSAEPSKQAFERAGQRSSFPHPHGSRGQGSERC